MVYNCISLAYTKYLQFLVTLKTPSKYNMNNIAESVEPWGTPRRILMMFEVFPLKVLILCFLFLRYD